MAETVAVDLDDVVVETAAAIIKHVNANYGTLVNIDNFYSRDPSVWGAPDIETAVQRVNSFMESDTYFDYPPIQEAVHALRGLKAAHKLYIVTGRPDFTELATRKWLADYLPDLFEDVVFTGYFMPEARTKGEVCRELGATVLIDDHIDHCESALEFGIRPLLFGNYPWNQSEQLTDGILRADNWPIVEEILLKDGKQ